MRLACPACGKSLTVPDEHAGKRGTCPGCGGSIQIPREIPRASSPADALPALEPAAPPPVKTCPSCSQELSDGAVVCTSCGLDLRTGRRLGQRLEPEQPQALEVDTTLEGALPVELISLFLPLAIVPYGTSVKMHHDAGSMQIKAWYANVGLMILTGLASAYVLVTLMAGDPRTLAAHALWSGSNFSVGQLVTSVFLHASIAHLLGNMVFLWVFGSSLSMATGMLWYPLIYLGLGVCAGYLGHVLPAGAGPDVPCIGASGAIMGLNGMFLVLFGRTKVHMAAWFRLLWFTEPHVKIFAVRGVWAVLFFIAFDVAAIVLGWTGTVAHGVHLAGFVSGVALGLVLLQTGAVKSHGDDVVAWLSKGSGKPSA